MTRITLVLRDDGIFFKNIKIPKVLKICISVVPYTLKGPKKNFCVVFYAQIPIKVSSVVSTILVIFERVF